MVIYMNQKLTNGRTVDTFFRFTRATVLLAGLAFAPGGKKETPNQYVVPSTNPNSIVVTEPKSEPQIVKDGDIVSLRKFDCGAITDARVSQVRGGGLAASGYLFEPQLRLTFLPSNDTKPEDYWASDNEKISVCNGVFITLGDGPNSNSVQITITGNNRLERLGMVR